MEQFLQRLLTGILVIWLVEYVLGVITFDTKIKKILTLITVIITVIYILFGQTLIH